MNIPVLLMADSYKLGHHLMYPAGIQFLQANITPRSDKHLRKSSLYDGKMVVMGIGAALGEFYQEWDKFFNTEWVLIEVEISGVIKATDPNFDLSHYKSLHDLGKLPLRIDHIPDGSLVDIGTPIMLVENTHQDFAWLVNFCETMLLNMIWHTCTTATVAREYRRVMDFYAEKTADDNSFVDWQGHDFSLRGMEGMQAGAMSGLGHLAFFKGSDNMAACYLANRYYNAENDFGSVYATEHSVATSNIQYNLNRNGLPENMELNEHQLRNAESEFLERLMKRFPSGVLSYVTDSYDYWGVLNHILPDLKKSIMSRNGTLVIRPDSGDPVKIICGDKDKGEYSFKDFEEMDSKMQDIVAEDAEYQLKDRDADDYFPHYFHYDVSVSGKLYCVQYHVDYDSYGGDPYPILCVTNVQQSDIHDYPLNTVEKGSIQYLWELFGGTVNEKGYKVLDPHIRLIYGDGITIERLEEILGLLEEEGFSSENVVFGIGSYPYQSVTRDTLGFAYKATYCEVNGESIPVFKSPKTDANKKSARGYISIFKEDNVWKYSESEKRECSEYSGYDELILFIERGKSLKQIRKDLK